MRLARAARTEATTFHVSDWVRFSVFTDALMCFSTLVGHELSATVFAASFLPASEHRALAECMAPVQGFDEFTALQARLLRTQVAEAADVLAAGSGAPLPAPGLPRVSLPTPTDYASLSVPGARPSSFVEARAPPPGAARPPVAPRGAPATTIQDRAAALYRYKHPNTGVFVSIAALSSMAWVPMQPRPLAISSAAALPDDQAARPPLTGEYAAQAHMDARATEAELLLSPAAPGTARAAPAPPVRRGRGRPRRIPASPPPEEWAGKGGQRRPERRSRMLAAAELSALETEISSSESAYEPSTRVVQVESGRPSSALELTASVEPPTVPTPVPPQGYGLPLSGLPPLEMPAGMMALPALSRLAPAPLTPMTPSFGEVPPAGLSAYPELPGMPNRVSLPQPPPPGLFDSTKPPTSIFDNPQQ